MSSSQRFLQLTDISVRVLREYKNALPFGRALAYCSSTAKALQHLTALFIMIAYLVRISKKIVHLHEF